MLGLLVIWKIPTPGLDKLGRKSTYPGLLKGDFTISKLIDWVKFWYLYSSRWKPHLFSFWDNIYKDIYFMSNPSCWALLQWPIEAVCFCLDSLHVCYRWMCMCSSFYPSITLVKHSCLLQLLLTFDPVLVEKVATVLYLVMLDNPTLPRLYLTGVFFFIQMYTGSNVLPIVRFLKYTHLKQAFRAEEVSYKD